MSFYLGTRARQDLIPGYLTSLNSPYSSIWENGPWSRKCGFSANPCGVPVLSFAGLVMMRPITAHPPSSSSESSITVENAHASCHSRLCMIWVLAWLSNVFGFFFFFNLVIGLLPIERSILFQCPLIKLSLLKMHFPILPFRPSTLFLPLLFLISAHFLFFKKYFLDFSPSLFPLCTSCPYFHIAL